MKEVIVNIKYVSKDLLRVVRVGPTTSVHQLLTRAVAKCNCCQRDQNQMPFEQFGLYLPQKGVWLDNVKPLQHYNINSGDILELHYKKEPLLNKIGYGSPQQHYAEGWLSKRGGRNPSWKLRWFVLKNTVLSYYKKKTDEDPAGQIDLGNPFDFGHSFENNRPSTEGLYEFFITIPMRTFYLSTESELEFSHWIRILRNLQNEADGETVGESDNSDDEEGDAPIKQSVEQEVLQVVQRAMGEKSGYLLKRGKSTKTYRRRWFVLQDTVLCYFPSHQNLKCKQIINLEGSQILDKSKSGKLFRFKIISGPKTFFLICDSQEDFEDWCEAFQYVAGVEISKPRADSGEAGVEPNFEDFELEGYLMKQGHNVINSWRKRWFMLRGKTLFYSTTKENKEVLLGSIPLSISTIKLADEKTKRPCSFEIFINTNGRAYFLQASSEVERDAWIEKLTMK